MKMHRRRWALSQRELGHLLLGTSTSALSRYESGACHPPLRVAVALQIVFGEAIDRLYPRLYEEIADGVVRQAASFSIELQSDDSTRGQIKRELLAAIGDRSSNAHAL